MTVALNTILALTFVLGFHFGIAGIAAATGITAWINVALLATGLYRRRLLGVDARLAHVLPRILLATAAMAVALILIERPFADWWSGPIVHRIAGLAALVGGGLAIYGGAVFATGVARPSDLHAMLRRPKMTA